MKVLYFDIENTPIVARTWSLYQDSIDPKEIVSPSTMISWAAQERLPDGRTRPVVSDVVTPEEASARDDSRIVESLANKVRSADIVIGHNIDRHDLPILRKRLLVHDLEPLPAGLRSIDTLKLARRDFKFESNSLGYIASTLLGETKGSTNAELWRRCDAGDPVALRSMDRYCRRDVRIGLRVFEAMLPHLSRIQRLLVPDTSSGGEHRCPYCEAEERRRFGWYHTATSSYQRYQCLGCRRYYRAASAKSRTSQVRAI